LSTPPVAVVVVFVDHVVDGCRACVAFFVSQFASDVVKGIENHEVPPVITDVFTQGQLRFEK
jgi:hypothetical protein